MKRVFLIIVLLTAIPVLGDLPLPVRKVEKLTIDIALVKIADPKYGDYLSAIDSILNSKLDDKRKYKVLAAFFKDENRMSRLKEQGDLHDIQNSFRRCGKKLKNSDRLFLELLAHDLYSLNKSIATKQLRWRLCLAIRDLEKSPGEEVINALAKVNPGEKMDEIRLSVAAKFGDDELLAAALESTRTQNEKKQWDYYTSVIAFARYRPLVLKYMVDSYLGFGYPRPLFRRISSDDYDCPLGSYDKVSPKDAETLVKQLDRILKIKHVLLGNSDEDKRLKKDDIALLIAIRKSLVKKIPKAKK